MESITIEPVETDFGLVWFLLLIAAAFLVIHLLARFARKRAEDARSKSILEISAGISIAGSIVMVVFGLFAALGAWFSISDRINDRQELALVDQLGYVSASVYTFELIPIPSSTATFTAENEDGTFARGTLIEYSTNVYVVQLYVNE